MALPSRYWKQLVWLAGLICLILWLAPRFSSKWQLEHRQKLLLKAIDDRDTGDLKDLVSENYADDWGFKKDDILLAMDDITMQFAPLEILTHEETWTRSEGDAIYAARVRLGGNPMTPIGAELKSRVSNLQHPVIFTWKKESSWPWSWKLTKVSQDEINASAEYKPGMFRGGRDE